MAYYPRLTAEGIYNKPCYYSSSPFYPKYQLPNCTCYAYGRAWEIAGYEIELPTGNAGTWYYSTRLPKGRTPALGATGVWRSPSGNWSGHVATVEVINSDGTIRWSCSGYYRPISSYPPNTPSYFWTETTSPANQYRMNYMASRDYVFDGFIYNPEAEQGQPIVDARWYAKPTWTYCRPYHDPTQGYILLFDDEVAAQNNAVMIWNVLGELGWSLNATCAVMGVMSYESGLNPWRWGNDHILSSVSPELYGASTGYGLHMFTPPKGPQTYLTTSDGRWNTYAPNFSDITGQPEDGDAQCRYIHYACTVFNHTYPGDFNWFYKNTTSSLNELVRWWLRYYGKGAHETEETIALRTGAAEYWFNFLQGYEPSGPIGDKSHKMPVWMMLKYF